MEYNMKLRLLKQYSISRVCYTSFFAILDASEAVVQVQEETGVQIHGVLGTQFLVENKWVVDFEKLTINNVK